MKLNSFNLKTVREIIVIIGLLLLFLPFFINKMNGLLISGTSEKKVFTMNYFEYTYSYGMSTLYHLRFPYLELIDLAIVLILPFALVIQILSVIFLFQNKVNYISSLFCFMSLSYFIYFNYGSLGFGCYILFFQQICAISCFKFISKSYRN